MKKKILTIIGARPQIIKAAAISRAVKSRFADKVEEKILHTGQHYDQNMSQVFIDELGIPQPDFNLGVGSGRHGEQSAKMIEGIEGILLSEKFDGVIVYGDTNSTLAASVAASKIHIPIFHIEAGLRSFNMSMPEEVNRIVCDQLSSILFVPTSIGMKNLNDEGFLNSKALFANGKGRRVVNSGDVMYDNSIYFASLAQVKSKILSENELMVGQYILVTIHRDSNTDDSKRLTSIFNALLEITERDKVKIVLPIHPRTSKLLPINLSPDTYKRLSDSNYIKIIPPVSFLDMIMLEIGAKLIMTDSGGVQKESYFFGKPCVIFRPETEWEEIVNVGAAILADADTNIIIESYHQLSQREVKFSPLYGDGDAAGHILNEILDYLLP